MLELHNALKHPRDEWLSATRMSCRNLGLSTVQFAKPGVKRC